MIRLFFKELKTHQYILLSSIFIPVVFFTLLLSTGKSLLHVPILNSLILNFPFITIIYLAFQYFHTFYGKKSLYTRTLFLEKWKPYFVCIVCSNFILLIALFSEQIVFQSLNIFSIGPTKMIPLLLEHAWDAVGNSYMGYGMVLSCLYFAISFSCSNFFDQNRFLWAILSLGIFTILVTLFDMTHSISTELFNRIIFLTCTISSFYLYIKKGIIQL